MYLVDNLHIAQYYSNTINSSLHCIQCKYPILMNMWNFKGRNIVHFGLQNSLYKYDNDWPYHIESIDWLSRVNTVYILQLTDKMYIIKGRHIFLHYWWQMSKSNQNNNHQKNSLNSNRQYNLYIAVSIK